MNVADYATLGAAVRAALMAAGFQAAQADSVVAALVHLIDGELAQKLTALAAAAAQPPSSNA